MGVPVPLHLPIAVWLLTGHRYLHSWIQLERKKRSEIKFFPTTVLCSIDLGVMLCLGEASLGRSGVASSSKFACGKRVWNGKVVWKCAQTKRGVNSTHFINVWKVCFVFNVHLFFVYWGYLSVWIMCGKGFNFIDTFHTIRVLQNFLGQAGYATFPLRTPPPDAVSCLSNSEQ